MKIIKRCFKNLNDENEFEQKSSKDEVREFLQDDTVKILKIKETRALVGVLRKKEYLDRSGVTTDEHEAISEANNTRPSKWFLSIAVLAKVALHLDYRTIKSEKVLLCEGVSVSADNKNSGRSQL